MLFCWKFPEAWLIRYFTCVKAVSQWFCNVYGGIPCQKKSHFAPLLVLRDRKGLGCYVMTQRRRHSHDTFGVATVFLWGLLLSSTMIAMCCSSLNRQSQAKVLKRCSFRILEQSESRTSFSKSGQVAVSNFQKNTVWQQLCHTWKMKSSMVLWGQKKKKAAHYVHYTSREVTDWSKSHCNHSLSSHLKNRNKYFVIYALKMDLIDT